MNLDRFFCTSIIFVPACIPVPFRKRSKEQHRQNEGNNSARNTLLITTALMYEARLFKVYTQTIQKRTVCTDKFQKIHRQEEDKTDAVSSFPQQPRPRRRHLACGLDRIHLSLQTSPLHHQRNNTHHTVSSL